MNLCLLDLVELTGGRLRLADMPPRDGELAAIRRIALDAQAVSSGDVFWRLAPDSGDAELAFLRGAQGVVAGGRPIDPWPGAFSLSIDDPIGALSRFVDYLRRFSRTADWQGNKEIFPASEQSSRDLSELKVLQLCAARGVDIYPLTCGRSAKGHPARRCRRQAA